MSLLTPDELAAIQEVGLTGMASTVEIYTSSIDEGGDLTDDPYGSKESFATTPITTVGWLVGEWARNRNVAAGDIDTTTTYRLRLPVGTAINVGDRVVIGAGAYTVIDAGTDQTWPEWLVCILHRSK